MLIPEDLYKTIIDQTVNLCVDILLKKDGKSLLIKRVEEPCKGVYWPIGGRIHKGETAEKAARRKIQEEIGINYTDNLRPIGFYEDHYTANSFSNNTSYHTLSIVFEGTLTTLEEIKLDNTSEEWGFFEDIPDRFIVNRF